MNNKDKESFIKVGDAIIYPEKFLSNPIGVCSYQAYYEIEKLQAENVKLKKFISALGYDEVFNDVIESIEKLEEK